MAAWVKVAAVLAGLFGLAAVVTIYGLPPRAVQQGTEVAAVPPAGGTPAKSAGTEEAAGKPAAKAADAASATATGAAQGTAQVAKAEPQAPASPSGPAAEAPAPLDPPTFDIVRVLPSGEVVVAGRAAPGATVELMRNGQPHQKAVADASGQFVMVPPNLSAGTHDLSLVMTLADGRRETSRQSVAVSVPADATGNVIVALASPDKPTQILSALPSASAPLPAKPSPAATGERPGVLLGSVEVEESGRFFATGRAAPGAVVRLYINDTFLAAATASPEGTWSFTVTKGVEPGSYRVRVDDVDGKGTVLSRAEVPFDYAPRVARGSSKATAVATAPLVPAGKPAQGPAGAQVASTQPTVPGGSDVVVDEIRTTTVTRGDSLWRISKRIYGKGLRYTVIYEANLKQIRDPQLIYPGQLFVLPGDKAN